IKWYHNIPVLGWLVLGGRCRHCGKPISLRYPAVEIIMALLFVGIITREGFSLLSVITMIMMVFLVALFFIDLKIMLLPDRLTLPLLLLALMPAFLKTGKIGIEESCLAACIGFILPWILNRWFSWRNGMPGMGMGDMKLFAVIGAWLG